ncbi:MAG: LytR family transcriptional regulator, partial [Frankiales bacterium]|nr:LytR family transcriptional regulator [Frankiales bacterium]
GCPAALRPVALLPVAATAVVLPAPGQVRLRLLNGTPRDGLGRTVGAALAARGFGVLSTGNAPAPLPGPSRVAFGPGGRPAATLLAAHVSGARLVPSPAMPRGAVDLVLGAAFVRLRTPAEVARSVTALTAPAPAPARTPVRTVPRPSPSPRC